MKPVTSRTDDLTKILIYIALMFCAVMVAMSIYNIVYNVLNAAAWAMLIFFAYLMTGILLYEENIFPTLPKQKWPSFMVSWAAMFFGVPILVSFITSMDPALLFVAAIFIIPALVATFHIIVPEKQWVLLKKGISKKIPHKKKKRKVRKFK